MTAAEVCEVLNQKPEVLAKFRPGSAVLFTSEGHRIQRTRDGFRPLNRSKEQARRVRQMERAKAKNGKA